MKKSLIGVGALVGLFLIVVAIGAYAPSDEGERANITDTTEENGADITPAPDCTNYEEIETFSEPIPIVWTAKLTGCLVSCEGGHFSRYPYGLEYQHPRFVAYGKAIQENYDRLKEEGALARITGLWTDVGPDHPNTVFGGLCVPTVEIQELEIIEE